MNFLPMKSDNPAAEDLHDPLRKTLEKLEFEDADRKPRLRDRIKRFFKRRRPKPPED